MNGSWQNGSPKMQFQFGSGKKPSLVSVILIAITLALFLVFGIGLLMIVATLLVLMLPWLWWKKRQLIQRMQQAKTAYQAQQQDPSASGVVIEGEVVERDPPQARQHKAADNNAGQMIDEPRMDKQNSTATNSKPERDIN